MGCARARHSARDDSAADLVGRTRADYEVVGGEALAWKSTVLMLRLDGCASFVTWDPSTLPAHAIDRAPRPEHCQPQGSADCRHLDFEGDRRLPFEEIEATRTGSISFRARSKGFAAPGALRIASTDAGATWSIEPAPAP